MSQELPIEILEQRAAEQRTRIHGSVSDLKQLKDSAAETVREKLDIKRQARQHFWAASGAAGVVALALGYGVAGIFTD